MLSVLNFTQFFNRKFCELSHNSRVWLTYFPTSLKIQIKITHRYSRSMFTSKQVPFKQLCVCGQFALRKLRASAAGLKPALGQQNNDKRRKYSEAHANGIAPLVLSPVLFQCGQQAWEREGKAEATKAARSGPSIISGLPFLPKCTVNCS